MGCLSEIKLLPVCSTQHAKLLENFPRETIANFMTNHWIAVKTCSWKSKFFCEVYHISWLFQICNNLLLSLSLRKGKFNWKLNTRIILISWWNFKEKNRLKKKLYYTCKTKMLALFKTDAMKTQAIILRCLLLVIICFFLY